jgi:hypothetical protein
MRQLRVLPFGVLFAALLFAGCSMTQNSTPPPTPIPVTGAVITGKVMSGLLPVSGAHVYVFAANNSGYGSASLSLLDGSSTGFTDATGGYVLSASDGSFSTSGYYTCTSQQQIYLYATGGDSGQGPNPAATDLAIVGVCPQVGTEVAPVVIDEVTTVATAYALAGFATDPVHISSSGTPQALTGIANAFINASNLATTYTGTALQVNPSENAIVPQSTINTLANILFACVHSDGASSAPCITLMSSVNTSGAAPTDTATAIIDIAQSPATNVAPLFGLQTAASAFAPALSNAPNDFSIGIVYSGGGMSRVDSMAVDAQGNVWLLSTGGPQTDFKGSIVEISSSGAFLSGSAGYPLPAPLTNAGPLAIDTSGNVWLANDGAALSVSSTTLIEISGSGTVLSGANDISGNSLNNVTSMAFDAAGDLWMTNSYQDSLTELSPSGQFLSGTGGFLGGGLAFPGTLSIEPSGNVWVGNGRSVAVSEFSSAGEPTSGGGGITSSGFYGGVGSAIDNQGNVWFTTQGTTGEAQVSKLSSFGAILSGSTGYTSGGIATNGGGKNLAIDGDGNVWIPLYDGLGVVELSNSGNVLSGGSGYENGILRLPLCVAVDGSGNVWVSNQASAPRPILDTDQITELIGIATPVVTPLAAGVKNNTLGVRP